MTHGATGPAPAGGFTVWLTGLSGAGKRTIGGLLERELRRRELRVEVLVGSEFRRNLSLGLGYSRADRASNVRRIGYVAKLLTRNGVAVVTTSTSPDREVRDECRRMIGAFVEVWVECPLEICEARDRDGVYERARRGEIEGVVGLTEPYEPPERPEVVCHTARETPEESAAKIVAALEALGYLTPDAAPDDDAAIKSQLRSLGYG